MTTSISSPTRRIELAGVHNLRDVGGYRAGARTTRWGKLFRADALHELDGEGQRRLNDLGVGLVVDLRDATEIEHAPDALDGVECRHVHHPIFDGPTNLGPAGFNLSALYTMILETHADRLTQAVQMVASEPEGVIVHCTAGKDRTGLVIALALSAVGVDDRDIAADYSLSEVMLAGEWADRMIAKFTQRYPDSDSDITGIVTSSPAAVILGSLKAVRENHGDAAGYLRSHGMDIGDLDRLRSTLLD
ncbi:MAG: tyrosine-protein phosphatase [Rhodococcus sp.]|nr:tyrosine-protein phosphatase [Rhodococcus sp. (in: high G+C Gram-positive bacteria)]